MGQVRAVEVGTDGEGDGEGARSSEEEAEEITCGGATQQARVEGDEADGVGEAWAGRGLAGLAKQKAGLAGLAKQKAGLGGTRHAKRPEKSKHP